MARSGLNFSEPCVGTMRFVPREGKDRYAVYGHSRIRSLMIGRSYRLKQSKRRSRNATADNQPADAAQA